MIKFTKKEIIITVPTGGDPRLKSLAFRMSFYKLIQYASESERTDLSPDMYNAMDFLSHLELTPFDTQRVQHALNGGDQANSMFLVHNAAL